MKIKIKVKIGNDDPIGALDYAARTISVDDHDIATCSYYSYMLCNGDMTKQEAIKGLKGHIGKILSKICTDDSRYD